MKDFSVSLIGKGNKLIKECTVTSFPSGLIMITFDCTKRYASVYRNANTVFTISIMNDGLVTDQQIVNIPELENIGITSDYYLSYSYQKEQAVVHCIPWKFYEDNI